MASIICFSSCRKKQEEQDQSSDYHSQSMHIRRDQCLTNVLSKIKFP